MKRPDMEPLALTPGQVAQAIGISESAVFDMLKRGDLPCIRILGKQRVRRTDLERWLANQPATTGIVDVSTDRAAS